MVAKTKFLSTKEVAEALGFSLLTARNIMMRADFPLVRVGKNFKVSEHAFIEWRKKEEFNTLKQQSVLMLSCLCVIIKIVKDDSISLGFGKDGYFENQRHQIKENQIVIRRRFNLLCRKSQALFRTNQSGDSR